MEIVYLVGGYGASVSSREMELEHLVGRYGASVSSREIGASVSSRGIWS